MTFDANVFIVGIIKINLKEVNGMNQKNWIKEIKMKYKVLSRILVLVTLDAMTVFCSYFLALYLRFDFVFGNIDSRYLEGYISSMPYWIVVTILMFRVCKLYQSVWSFASIAELQRIVEAYMLLAVAYLLGAFLMDMNMPRSYYCIGIMLSFCATIGIRFSYRLFRMFLTTQRRRQRGKILERIMVIGAGAAGQVIVKELRNSEKMQSRVCCIIDDNEYKKGKVLEGVPIVGNRYDIPRMVEKYSISHIIYAIPTASAQTRKEILSICKECAVTEEFSYKSHTE